MAYDAKYTPEQLQKLEELFVECKFPNKNFIKKWSKDLGMDRDQIKSWFENKRLLIQIEEKSQENAVLRMENTRIQWENIVMRNKLENLQECSTYSSKETREYLQRENAKLREEHHIVTSMLVGMLQNPDLLQLQGQESTEDVDVELRLAPSCYKGSST